MQSLSDSHSIHTSSSTLHRRQTLCVSLAACTQQPCGTKACDARCDCCKIVFSQCVRGNQQSRESEIHALDRANSKASSKPRSVLTAHIPCTRSPDHYITAQDRYIHCARSPDRCIYCTRSPDRCIYCTTSPDRNAPSQGERRFRWMGGN